MTYLFGITRLLAETFSKQYHAVSPVDGYGDGDGYTEMVTFLDHLSF